jgi:hypothetical protein
VIWCAIHSAVGCGVTLIQTSSRRAKRTMILKPLVGTMLAEPFTSFDRLIVRGNRRHRKLRLHEYNLVAAGLEIVGQVGRSLGRRMLEIMQQNSAFAKFLQLRHHRLSDLLGLPHHVSLAEIVEKFLRLPQRRHRIGVLRADLTSSPTGGTSRLGIPRGRRGNRARRCAASHNCGFCRNEGGSRRLLRHGHGIHAPFLTNLFTWIGIAFGMRSRPLGGAIAISLWRCQQTGFTPCHDHFSVFGTQPHSTTWVVPSHDGTR